jgi:nucleoid-associated protein YgaU
MALPIRIDEPAAPAAPPRRHLVAVPVAAVPAGPDGPMGRVPFPYVRILGMALAVLFVLGGVALSAGRAAPASPPGRPAVRVVVAPGDTLWGIAERWAPGGSDPRWEVDAIRSANAVDPANLQPGDVLLVP